MKRLIIVPLLALGLARVAVGAPALFYVNDGIINATNPPVIDAINFINNNTFDVFTFRPYRTASTLNFTNRGEMSGNPGFDFRTFPESTGSARMASSFHNKATGANGGVINCTGSFSFIIANLLFGNLTGSSQFIVGATNIINSGSINMDASSLILLKGFNVDLSRGALTMVDTFNLFNGFTFFNAGIMDGYWGIGNPTNAFSAANFFNGFPVFTPGHIVTTRNSTLAFEQLVLSSNAVPYVNDSGPIGNNRFVQAVFLDNTNSAFATSVFFDPLEIAVQWQWNNTDTTTGVVNTNFLVLTDSFGETTNQAQLLVDGFVGNRPTFIPDNYFFFSGFDISAGGTFPGATPGLPPTTFDNTRSTNQYTAYEGIFSAATQFPADAIHSDITNIAGRMQIVGMKNLNLTQSRISALNTLMLEATNHYSGNLGAKVTAPYYDLNLRTTNGGLIITNLVPETLAHSQGTCQLWSGRWTNVVAGITNSFHVLVVEGLLSPTTKPTVQGLTLRCTKDLIISDQLNVTRSLQLTATNITITTNGFGASSTVGGLNFMSQDIVWPASTPRLQNLTNWGFITTLNAVFFGGSRGTPFYTTTFNETYRSFVNHGGITNNGSLIWSKYFENTGTFNSGFGAINLQKATDTILSGGAFLALTNDISILTRNLTVTNHLLFAGGSLNLWITNSLSGGNGLTNGNIFFAGDGFNLFRKPTTGDLLGTTVTNFSPAYAQTLSYWAGLDRGSNNIGFSNNVAIGRLVLNGSTNATFRFIGTGKSNAMYVDSLELQGTATNFTYDGSGYVLPYLGFDSSMKIYFAQATMNGISVAEHLNGANHGHLVWMPSYAGNFSSVTLSWTNELGTNFTYTMNAALRDSTFIDSDGDGIVNRDDPFPLGDPPSAVLVAAFSPSLVRLSVALTKSPTAAALVSWNTIPNSTNYLYAKSSYTGTNWLTVTNFVYKGPAGRVTVRDSMKADGPHLYRVRVDPPQK